MANIEPLDIETLGHRIRYAREAAGLTQGDLASHFKISRVSVTNWEADDTKPAIGKLTELAALLNTTVPWLLERVGTPPLAVAKPARRSDAAPAMIPGDNVVGRKDLPVYPVAMGGAGHLIVTFDAIDWVKRPEVLDRVRGGYALYIVNDSMFPAYEQGDMALINPHLPPQRDKDVVLYHLPPVGEAECIIKRLLRFDDRDWHLKQWNPPKEFTEARTDWQVCHRVVGKYNQR